MRVKVAKRMYQMNRDKYRGLLKLASEQVPFGIYAVEKNGYAELCHLHCKSITQLKREVRDFRKAGWKVHYNGKE